MKAMHKVLIVGNSGSGKSWLARRLAKRLNVLEINLDSVFWEPGGYGKKRTQVAVDNELAKLHGESGWVVEGVFGALVEKLICSADTLIFLDIDWSVCASSLRLRGAESAKQMDVEAAQRSFDELLAWAGEYSTRNSKSSYRFHLQLFQQFTGNKIRFSTREEVNAFIASVNL